MYPDRRKNDYRTYHYIAPSNSTSAQKSRDRATNPQRSFYSSTTHTSPRTEQSDSSSTALANLAEPLSIFDDLKPSVNRRVNVTPYPLAYIPPNPSRRSSVRDARLVTANAVRERLLSDIQNNISEIDREITSLEQRRYTPPRFTSVQNPIPSPSGGNHLWIRKQRKVYEVVPRIKSEVRPLPVTPTVQLPELPPESPVFIGQYHYGPEIGEVRIGTTDPENADRNSVLDELSDFETPETFTVSQFCREQSPLPHHRALISVPEYADYNDVGFNEFTEDLRETNPKDRDVARSLTASPFYEFPSPEKMSIQDFQTLIQTAPEPEIQVPVAPPIDNTPLDLTNTMLSKPVKHARLSTRVPETVPTTAQPTNTSTENDVAYFFSDFGNEGEEDRISIDYYPFILPTASEIIPDDNTSNIFIRQSQVSLLNPHAVRPPLDIETNNEYLKETEGKNVAGAATKHPAPSTTSTAPSTKPLPTSLRDNMQTKFSKNNKKNTEDQRRSPLTSTPTNIIEQSRANKLDNFSVRLQGSPLISDQKKTTKSTTDQRSPGRSSQRQSNKEIERVVDNKQQTSGESQNDLSLPVPLISPEFDNVRPSTSRTATPERRNSIPSLDENILLDSNFDDLLAEHLQTESSKQVNRDRLESDPLTNFTALQDLQSDESKLDPSSSSSNENEPVTQDHIQETDRMKSISPLTVIRTKSAKDDLCLPALSPRQSDVSDANLTSIGQEDTFKQLRSPDHDHDQVDQQSSDQENPPRLAEELSWMTPSQQRSKLSLLVRPSRPEQKPTVNDQAFQTHVEGSEKAVARHQTKENHRPLKDWRERINNVLEKKQLPSKKYSHIKSRVDSFANFEYQPRRILIVPKKLSTHPKDNRLAKRIARFHPQLTSGPTPQIFGRLWCLPDGSTSVFHESLEWKSESKIKSRSPDPSRQKLRLKDFKIFNEKPRWHSESKISELLKESPRRRLLTQSVSLLQMTDVASLRQHESSTELRIYDTNFDSQQTTSELEENSLGIVPKDSKLRWRKKSKLKDSTWANIDYQPKPSQVQIFHQPVHWKKQSKLRLTYSLSWDNQAKVKYSSMPPATQRKGLFAQSHDPQWKDIPCSLIEEWESRDQTDEESPANRPKWNAVSKTRSVNSVYNPAVSIPNSIRRGWDLDLRRKRVHKLPPLKRKRDLDDIPQLAIEAPSPKNLLAIEDHYDRSLLTHDGTTSIEYGTLSSRRSSKALVPLPLLPNLQLSSNTPRSQRPIQQEWYDEPSKFFLTHRADVGRNTRSSSRNLYGSVHQTNTPRELRSSIQNSQHGGISSHLIDSSIRTNRTTELRLSKDMDEHHHHSHEPNQSLPIEIRGFRLEGTQLTVPNNASIRPLSNVSYRASERVKTHRLYPWSVLHATGASSRNSSLVPIVEYQRPSMETSSVEIPRMIHEE